jgi:hypothetical protein
MEQMVVASWSKIQEQLTQVVEVDRLDKHLGDSPGTTAGSGGSGIVIIRYKYQ